MEPVELFNAFVAAINRHDVNALRSLMTEDHAFVDSQGHCTQGADSVAEGWPGYFKMCPDYWIRAADIAQNGLTVLAGGEAGGTIDRQTWRIPAAWKAVMRDGRVAVWQVFADIKPVYDILARRKT